VPSKFSQSFDGHDANNEIPREQFTVFDPAQEIDTLNDILLEETMGMNREKMGEYYVQYFTKREEELEVRTKAKTLRQSFGLYLSTKNAKLTSFGIMFAMGFQDLCGLTMTEAAKKLNVTKAAVSKAAVKAAKILDIERSRYMKSEKACEAYRQRQLEINRKKTNTI
jgi:hypothetical protein